jgi:8-oxo-dGDP phosphatase
MRKPHIDAWKILKSTTLFAHKRLTVAEDEVQLPDGNVIRWLHYPNASDFAVVIAVNAADEFLISYQYNHPNARVVEEFPGGMIDEGESITDAARRELREETGWIAADVRHIGTFLVNNRRSKTRGHVVVATGLTAGDAAPEAGEIIETEWVPRANLRAAIRDGTIENITLLAAWAIFAAEDGGRQTADGR